MGFPPMAKSQLVNYLPDVRFRTKRHYTTRVATAMSQLTLLRLQFDRERHRSAVCQWCRERALVEPRALLLPQNPCQCSHQNVWVSRLVNQLAGRTGAFQFTEAAVNNERNVARFKPGAHIGSCLTAMKSVVDDCRGELGLLAFNQCVLKRARDGNPGPSFLEAVRNVKSNDRFVLHDKH